jgi:hypothetical protein
VQKKILQTQTSVFNSYFFLDGQVLITSGLADGGHEGEYTKRSEILDLKNGNSYCTDWSPYAHDTEGSFGAFVNNEAIVSTYSNVPNKRA